MTPTDLTPEQLAELRRDARETLPIDFEAALRRGLDEIAREPDGGSTERFRKRGEHPSPVRTEPVTQLTMSVEEFVEATKGRGV